MSLVNLGLIFVAGLDFGVALLIYSLNPRNRNNILISLTILSLAAWTLGMGMFRNAYTETEAWIWVWVQNGFGSIIPVFLFLVSIYFPYQSVRVKPKHILLIVLSVVWMLVVVVVPGFLVKNIKIVVPNNYYDMNRLGIAYFNIHFYFYLVLSYIFFYKKYVKSSGIIRMQLNYSILSATTVGIIGSVFGALIPLIFNTLGYYWIGPYFAVPAMLILISFIYKANK